MGLLDGHKALVTGGASGIGRATARRMAQEGATVAVLDIDETGAKAVASEIAGHAFGVDVTDAAATERAVADAASAMGGLSIAFNNAGVGWIQPLHEYDLGQWDRVLRVSLYGVFHGMRAEVPIMLEGGAGRIVNTASISGTRPAAGEGAYSAAKAAIAALSASAALEYAPTIRVNAVSPGHVNSALTAPLDLMLPDHVSGIIAKTPVARAGEPEDIADVVVFLCSDQSRFMTGQNLIADGGLTLHTSGTDGLLEKVQALLSPASRSEGPLGPGSRSEGPLGPGSRSDGPLGPGSRSEGPLGPGDGEGSA